MLGSLVALAASSAQGQDDDLDKGVRGGAGYSAFETFGVNGPLSYVELMPYVYGDSQILFSEARFFSANTGQLGGNVGLGYRAMNSDLILGGSLRYDGGQAFDKLFHQVGLSLEAVSSTWEARANGYVPVGDVTQDISLTASNIHFSGNDLLYTRSRVIGQALTGFDAEVGLTLPFEVLEPYRVRANVGGYCFLGDAAPNITGVQARLGAQFSNAVSVDLAGSHDNFYGTNLNLIVAIQWGRRNLVSEDVPLGTRLLDFTRRNMNIIVADHSDVQHNLVAINPDTQQAYVFQHVSDSAMLSKLSGVDQGTMENPLATVAAAQDAGADIVFVHAGTELHETIFAEVGQRILGEGSPHVVQVAGYGSLALPSTGSGGDRPTISNSDGNAVVLASDSEVSGFTILNPKGSGIVANNVDQAISRHMEIVGAKTNGLRIENSSHVLLEDISVESAGGPGLVVNQNQGPVAFYEVNVVGKSSQRGIEVTNNSGDVLFDSVKIQTTGATAFYVRSSALTLQTGAIVAQNGTALDVQDAHADMELDHVSSSNAAVGIRLANVTGQVVVAGSSQGSAGTVENAKIGLEVVDSESVEVRGLNFKNNEVAVKATDVESLVLRENLIENSKTNGVEARDVRALEISDSTIRGSGGSAIVAVATKATTYDYQIDNNVLQDNQGPAVDLKMEASAASAKLGLTLTHNELNIKNANGTGLSLVWDGDLTSKVSYNTITGTADDQTGIFAKFGSHGSLAQAVFESNNITLDGADATGIRLDAQVATHVAVAGNVLKFSGWNATGLKLGFGEASAVDVNGNTFTATGSGGTAILFNQVDGRMNLTLEGNIVDFSTSNSVPEVGIEFQNVTDRVVLSGVYDNLLQGASTDLVYPSGKMSGHFYINSISVP